MISKINDNDLVASLYESESTDPKIKKLAAQLKDLFNVEKYRK